VDGLIIEPKHPIARHVDIRLARLPEEFDGFRIAQVSDIHFGPYMGRSGLERVLEVTRPFNPDLLVLTGDFVSHPLARTHGRAGALNAEPCADVLTRWKICPMAAVLGNHDHWNDPVIVAGALRDRGIPLLNNDAYPIERQGKRLWIGGVDDPISHAADLPRALRNIPRSEVTVLLAHEPDYADYVSGFAVDLQLSGHSHGGQVRLPGLGAIILPRMAMKYPLGLYRLGKMQLYTNAGVGVVTPPVRFNCPPEVTYVTLLGADRNSG
jgi:uncharacterized protein